MQKRGETMFHKLINFIEKLIVGGARPPNQSAMPEDKDTSEQQALVTQQPKTPKQIIVFRGVVIIVVLGVMVIIFAKFIEVDKLVVKSANTNQIVENPIDSSYMSPSAESPFSTIETALELRTKDILEKMIGVGKVSVLITVESTEEQIIEQNKNESKSYTQETDKNGGMREITTTTNDGQVVFLETGKSQEPVVTKVINPRIRGVLIVAEGAEDATVRKLIIQAVEKGLNVHQSKISVVPSKI